MNIAVVDDEEVIREQIGGFIKKRNPDFDISGFATGEGLLAAGKDFDIIFLDIQMEGIGGIEAARTLRQSGVDAVVIFITGIREYVFEAFDVSAFHYLLKPIEEQKFMEVLGRAAAEAGKRKGQKERQIFIRAKNQGYTLNLNSILYIESRGKKVEVHTTDMEDIIESYATMDGLEGKLGGGFYRSNYNNVYGSTYTAQKNEEAKKTETKEAAPAQAKNTGADSVSDYYSYLQKNYDCVKNGSVAISGSYLKECARNPEKAKELEESLAYFKEGYENGLKSAQANARAIGARVVNYSESWSIDNTGNITMMASTTVTSDSGIKGWKELAEDGRKN